MLLLLAIILILFTLSALLKEIVNFCPLSKWQLHLCPTAKSFFFYAASSLKSFWHFSYGEMEFKIVWLSSSLKLT